MFLIEKMPPRRSVRLTEKPRLDYNKMVKRERLENRYVCPNNSDASDGSDASDAERPVLKLQTKLIPVYKLESAKWNTYDYLLLLLNFAIVLILTTTIYSVPNIEKNRFQIWIPMNMLKNYSASS